MDGPRRGTLQGGRVLVTGAAGMLGSQLVLDAPDGFETLGTDLAPAPSGSPAAFVPGVDLTDADAVRAFFAQHGPFDAVLHPAAYTAVDKAEEEEELARAVNARAAENVARACAGTGAPMVLVSTDFVFDGSKGAPYVEDDPARPLGAYGRTKREGEELALSAWPEGVRVVRTQWLYGPRGKHFPGTMLRLAAERDELRVVSDQVGSPTTTLELSPALWDALLHAPPGIYHGTCEGQCSWFDLAAATLEEAGVEGCTVHPCSTSEYPTPARRPAYSVLDGGKLAGVRGRPLAHWRDALRAWHEHETRASETA